jgi:hypothetical protein
MFSGYSCVCSSFAEKICLLTSLCKIAAVKMTFQILKRKKIFLRSRHFLHSMRWLNSKWYSKPAAPQPPSPDQPWHCLESVCVGEGGGGGGGRQTWAIRPPCVWHGRVGLAPPPPPNWVRGRVVSPPPHHHPIKPGGGHLLSIQILHLI